MVLPLVPPVYATSSHTVLFYVQLQDTSDMDQYLNVTLTPPPNSTQRAQTKQVRTFGRGLHEVTFTLRLLQLSDSGTYSCAVYVFSDNPYVYNSNVTYEVTSVYISGWFIL